MCMRSLAEALFQALFQAHVVKLKKQINITI